MQHKTLAQDDYKHHLFCNNGTYYKFNANKPLRDSRNPELVQTYLEFHLELCREAKSSAVFVLDRKGNEINPYL